MPIQYVGGKKAGKVGSTSATTTFALTASGTDILMAVTRDRGTTWRGIVSALDSK
jgi:hypothetical protein